MLLFFFFYCLFYLMFYFVDYFTKFINGLEKNKKNWKVKEKSLTTKKLIK